MSDLYEHRSGSHAKEDTAAQVFRKLILEWGIKELSEPQLECCALPRALADCDSERYYQNFIPLILEEARAILAQGLEAESKANTFAVRVINLQRRHINFPATLELEGRLPKEADEGTACMVLKLTYSGAEHGDFSILCWIDLKEQDRIIAKISLNNETGLYNTCSLESFLENNPKAFDAGSKWSACIYRYYFKMRTKRYLSIPSLRGGVADEAIHIGIKQFQN